MGKAKAKAKQAKGQLKESAGNVMDDKKMQAEGASEKVAGKAQETPRKTHESAAEAMERIRKAGH
ncbi:CsbD family protein [Streptomyces sp. NPDC101132]|uniref:CsbD family protein n=1 Tax=Streptomyces sp. NPDC101132 TaxID=3366110 RepID=UPI003809EC7E